MKPDCTITHVEIPAPDLNAASAFYAAVFDWKIEVIIENSYSFFIIGDTNTGGGLDASLKPAEKGVGTQLVINVDDINHYLERIVTAGGTITQTKTPIGSGEHGYFAAFKDPNGNHLQIHCER
ncbi:VOC family protein [Pedobacter sp.]|uniref:VOC family protein n=1 Tax=Pedobacter sp. TaxID=1411316 RepID=UPI003D7F954C